MHDGIQLEPQGKGEQKQFYKFKANLGDRYFKKTKDGWSWG